ncbi:MAG: MCE family protein [Streptosporangiales bacterium]|nr:MCE family protein [Streptosporangiales bacterium]
MSALANVFAPHRVLRFGVLVLIAAVVLGGAGIVVARTGQQQASASFPRTVGLYEGSDVRILGVKVGEVKEITPQGDSVRVDFEYDDKYKVPAKAKALVVAPSLVSDRYLQLAPVYDGGPTLPDGASIPRSRTAVPVELGEIYSSLDDLNTALGPEGANEDGSLSRLLKVGSDNLGGGTGADLKTTIEESSKALRTLNRGSGDLYGTIRNLSKFTTALKKNDAAVAEFNKDLAGVATQLDGEKEELAAALKNLGIALGKVNAFVKENKKGLKKNIDGLAEVTSVLTKQQKALREFLDGAPVALSNLQLAYNPNYGTLDNRNNFRQVNDPAMYLCSLLISLHVPQKQCDLVKEAFDQVSSRLPDDSNLSMDPRQRTAAEPVGRPDKTLGGILGKQQP